MPDRPRLRPPPGTEPGTQFVLRRPDGNGGYVGEVAIWWPRRDMADNPDKTRRGTELHDEGYAIVRTLDD